MKNTIPEALNLFSFIGLLPGGVNDEDLSKMWGNTSWMPLKDALIRASLLVYKKDSSGLFIYSMLPFMSIRAYELLEQNEERRHEYHMKWCKMFRDYCHRFYMSDKSIEKVEELVGMETNIWAWIYRSLNRKKDVKYYNSGDELSLERLSVNRLTGRNRKEDMHAMEKLTEEENESSWDESSNSVNDNILSSKNENVDRGVERHYRSHFRVSFKSDTGKEDDEEEDKHNSEGNREENSLKKPTERAKVNKIVDVEQQKKSKFFEEEMLVIYYITNLILINQQQDALRALTEYTQKSGISYIGSANLYKIYAVLLMMGKMEDKKYQTAVKCFKKARKFFYDSQCKKGVGLWKFGLAKLHYEYMNCVSKETLNTMNFKNEDMVLEASLNFTQNAWKAFKNIGYVAGEYYSDKFEDLLKKKMHAQDRGFKGTQYYIELSKRAKKQISKLKENSWIGPENALLLEIVLDDVSHLQPDEQQRIKKINGTLINLMNKKTKKHESRVSKFLKISDSKITEDKITDSRDSLIEVKNFSKPKAGVKEQVEGSSKLTVNIRMQGYQPTTPMKDKKEKPKQLAEKAVAKTKQIPKVENLKKDEAKREIWKI